MKSFQLKCAIWEITLKCNLNCSHCGSSAGKARKDELNTKEAFNLCEELAELGCENVALMGGEPFLREDWFSIGKSIKDLGMDLSFVSNGTILDKYIDKVAQLEPRVVGISIDGMKKTHEKIRGKGTYDKTIRAIDLLKERGIQTTVITTVSKLNFKDLPEMKDLFSEKGLNWQLQIATPFGNFQKKYMLSKEEFYSTALFMEKMSTESSLKDFPVSGAHCYGYYSNVLSYGKKWKGCTAGTSTIGITSDGGIVGCLAMVNNRLIEGNLKNKSLKEIWNNPDNFAYNRKFNSEEVGSNCKNCKFKSKCKGGCNAVSYALTGEFHNDPYCLRNIEKNIIDL